MGVAILHQSDEELAEALRKWPHMINQANGLAQTPLHLAVSWPHGVRELIQHGSCVDSVDHQGYTPLYYAIYLGFSETVNLLMKADCKLNPANDSRNFLWHVTQWVDGFGHGVWGVSQETRMDVLNTSIALLAKRRRDLQDRLAALPMAGDINTGVFRRDPILDKFAKDVLTNCETVYHIRDFGVKIAEKLWQHGFRDIDVKNRAGLTPLMLTRSRRNFNLAARIELYSWLLQKGAKLHRPQHSPLDYDPDRTIDPLELLPKTRALHCVAANIGWGAGSCGTKRSLLKNLDQLSEDARLLPTILFSDVSCDDCVCACSSQGCLAYIMMLKGFESTHTKDYTLRNIFLHPLEALLHLLGPQGSCWEWLVMGIIRFRTFEVLKLRHTCCQWSPWGQDCDDSITKLDSEEIVEIRDEDHEKIKLLESLLQEFEENRADQDLFSLLNGYWATRMDQVLREQGKINEEALRQMGIVRHPDETEILCALDAFRKRLSETPQKLEIFLMPMLDYGKYKSFYRRSTAELEQIRRAIKDAIEPTLGPAISHDIDSGIHLEFHRPANSVKTPLATNIWTHLGLGFFFTAAQMDRGVNVWKSENLKIAKSHFEYLLLPQQYFILERII